MFYIKAMVFIYFEQRNEKKVNLVKQTRAIDKKTETFANSLQRGFNFRGAQELTIIWYLQRVYVKQGDLSAPASMIMQVGISTKETCRPLANAKNSPLDVNATLSTA